MNNAKLPNCFENNFQSLRILNYIPTVALKIFDYLVSAKHCNMRHIYILYRIIVTCLSIYAFVKFFIYLFLFKATLPFSP